MLDSERNPGVGLAIRFWSSEQRRANVDTEELSRPFDEDVVIAAIGALADLEFVPLELRYPCGCLGHNFPGIVNKPMRLLALQHDRCLDCFVSDWIDPEVGWEGARFQLETDDVEPDVAFLAGILSGRTELFMDFLCALVQGNYTTDAYGGIGSDASRVKNRQIRDHVERRLNEALAPSGWQLVDGYPLRLAGMSLLLEPPLPWAAVQERMDHAAREIREGRFSDAVTDLGTAMQAALGIAGFSGTTLGDQNRQFRASPQFSGLHTKLGAGLIALMEWVGATRNDRGDAHPGASATEDEAYLLFGVVRSLVTYLLASQLIPADPS